MKFDQRLGKAVLRTGSSMLIGFGGAGALWGGLYLWQQHLASQSSENGQGYVPREWTLRTKVHVNRAALEPRLDLKIQQYRDALDTLVDATTDLTTKSADWLAGYADLLRELGLALVASGQFGAALAPLEAAATIPYGTDQLRITADVEIYRITGNTDVLLRALGIADPAAKTLEMARVPATTSNPSLYLELSKLLAAQKDYKAALAVALGVHRAMAADSPDTSCNRAAAAGYAGQLLWKLGHKDDARRWLAISSRDAKQSQSKACRDTAVLVEKLLAQTKQS